MTDTLDDTTPALPGVSRRGFLRRAGLAAGGAVLGGAAAAQDADPLITEVQDWASSSAIRSMRHPTACRSTLNRRSCAAMSNG